MKKNTEHAIVGALLILDIIFGVITFYMPETDAKKWMEGFFICQGFALGLMVGWWAVKKVIYGIVFTVSSAFASGKATTTIKE